MTLVVEYYIYNILYWVLSAIQVLTGKGTKTNENQE